MRVKDEYKAASNSESFLQRFDRYIDKYGKDKFWLEENVPKMKDVRGKVVILKNFDSEGNAKGIPWGNALIEDNYEVNSILKECIDRKWDNVRENLEKAQASESGLYISFCSGASSLGLAYPSDVADRVNPHVYEYISEHSGKNNFGVVVFDFPGRQLIQKIIDSNFFYKKVWQTSVLNTFGGAEECYWFQLTTWLWVVPSLYTIILLLSNSTF